MPTSEKITLDPSEIVTTRSSLDITAWIAQEGADWGLAEIEPFLADKDRGSVPVDYRLPNREITIPLRFTGPRGGTTTVQARAAIQAKAALFQKEGGWLKRLTNSGGTVYADIVDAAFAASSVSGVESAKDQDLDAHLTLTCLPDFYEQERTLGDHVETSNPELIFTETGIDGDYPARVRIKVDDDQGQDQRGLLFGFRNRYYDSANTAALTYQAESLQPLDTAAKKALSGASGGTVVKHGTISTNWTPVLGTNKGGTAYLTHKGTYRLYARVYSTSGTTVQARAVWDVGDLVNPVENDAWRLPGASNFYDVDFGEIRLDAPPVGTHRWQGQIQAKGDTGGENFSVDRLWMVPVDEGMGVLIAPLSITQGLASYSARDEFNQAAGNLGGSIMPVGGTWGTAGVATDFVLSGGGVVTRTATSDAGADLQGRLAVAPPVLTDTFARVDFKSVSTATVAGCGLVVRYTDKDNNLFAYASPGNTGGLSFAVRTRIAGTSALLMGKQTPGWLGSGVWGTLAVFVGADGTFFVWLVPQGSNLGLPSLSGQSSVLATAGALDDGKTGLYDRNGGVTAATRTYDNFGAWIPNFDAVTFASQSTQLTTDGHYRLDSGGTAYGPVAIQSGDLPRLPVAGLENRTTEIFLKGSRGDFDSLPDSGIDDISAQISYSPSWLVVPDT